MRLLAFVTAASAALRAPATVVFATVVGSAAISSAMPAAAHPHVWVTSKSRLVVEADRVAAVEQTWTFDEYYTAMAIQGLDANADGQYSTEELSELAKVNMEGLKEFGFFTHARHGETNLTFGTPTDARLDYTGGILSLNFRLPLTAPVPVATEGLVFATFDATYFVAFELAADEPVALTGGGAKTCTVALQDGQQLQSPAADQNQTLTGAFAEMFGAGNVSTVKWASIACARS